MSIQLFCGRPGSGKSYGVVENIILPALKVDRPIFTNIPLHLSAIAQDFPDNQNHVTQFLNEEVTPEYLVSLPGGAIVIIDECWRYWPGGAKATDIPQLYKEFFSEHRHKTASFTVDGKLLNLTQELVLLTQTPNQLAKMVRELIDTSVVTTKMNAIGAENRYQVQIFSGCIPSLERPGEPNNTGLGQYKPDIYKYYVSHTKSPSGLPGVEMRPDKRGSIWNNWYIRFLAPAIIIAALWGVYFIYGFFTKKPQIVESVPEPIIQPIIFPQNPEIKTSQIRPESKQYSKRYRVAGTFSMDGLLHVYIQDSETWRHIQVNPNDCKIDVNGPECDYNGERVTAYTGKHRETSKKLNNSITQVVPTL